MVNLGGGEIAEGWEKKLRTDPWKTMKLGDRKNMQRRMQWNGNKRIKTLKKYVF